MGRYDGGLNLFTASEFKNRGVIKIAPDAFISVGTGFETAIITPISGKTQKVQFQEGISAISVQNNVDPPGSSTATIEISTPIYDNQSSYWVSFVGDDGKTYKVPYFVSMMEIQVFFKGRFLVGDSVRYYPAFWGYIVNVEESYSAGVYKITLQCADMLHWWSHSTVAFRPGVESNAFVNGKQGLTVYGSRYKEANAYTIIYDLTRRMGFDSFVTPAWIGKQTNAPKTKVRDQRWMQIYTNIFQYWNARFADAPNLLKMYGAQGSLIFDPTQPKGTALNPVPPNPPAKSNNKSKQATANSDLIPIGADNKFVGQFPVFHEFANMKDLSQAEYMSKLEIATEVKTRVEYEFFQDVTGNFIFKPPFYNLDVRSALPYRIKPVDIINFSSSLNSDEIVTALEVQTSILKAIRNNNWVNEVGYHIDLDLVKRFGFRYKNISVWWLSENNLAYSYAAGHMGLLNAKAHVGSVTIPGRPEIRLGYPVYIDHKDCYYYVKSINHSFDFGGSFTTTLSLEGQRERIYDADKYGNVVTQKNKIFSRIDGSKTPQLVEQKYIQLNPEDPTAVVFPDNDNVNENSDDQQNKLNDLYRGAGFMKSLQPGMYEIIDAPEGNTADELNQRVRITGATVPYTDEFGYKVVGTFPYGRGIVLNYGTVIDGAEIQRSFTQTASDIINDFQTNTIANMKSAAEEEGNYMKDYFKNSKLPADQSSVGIESFIPNFVTFTGQDTFSTASILVGMQPKSKG